MGSQCLANITHFSCTRDICSLSWSFRKPSKWRQNHSVAIGKGGLHT